MSKATGIVRRIDDLGRIVIPKEVRRMFRIQEGDALEIFVSEEGVLLKKYSPIAELVDFAGSYAEALHESTNHISLISDKDTIITVAGGSKKDYLDKQIGSLVEDCMVNRKTILHNGKSSVQLLSDSNETYGSYAITPIIADGEPIGTVILVSKDDSIQMSQMEVKIAETAAGFLAKQMQ